MSLPIHKYKICPHHIYRDRSLIMLAFLLREGCMDFIKTRLKNKIVRYLMERGARLLHRENNFTMKFETVN